jgi:succinyl-CoA synthetase beta subunit
MMTNDRNAVRKILDQAKAAGRTSLTAPEARGICEAYAINIPKEGLARTGEEAVKLATQIGFPVVMKIVSPQILHKTEAGGVLVGVKSPEQVAQGFSTIIENARRYDSKAEIQGVQIQQMVSGGHEVIIGAVTDPAFGKLVAFGMGGVLVEVLKDITFRLAPASSEDALSMLDGIQAAEILRGVRGAKPVNRSALGGMIERVSTLVADFPEISELDLNPVFASPETATAADVRVVLDFNPAPQRYRPDQKLIVEQMNRIMKPRAVAPRPRTARSATP